MATNPQEKNTTILNTTPQWLRTTVTLFAAVAIVLGSATSAEAASSDSVAAPGTGYCERLYEPIWLDGSNGTQILWTAGNYCSIALPSHYTNNEIRRQNGAFFWEWITFDTCPSGWVYSAPVANCSKVSTTVQEFTKDHEIRITYWAQTPLGQVWLSSGTAVSSGTYTSPHFKYIP